MLLLFILLSRSWVKLSILLSRLFFLHYLHSFLYPRPINFLFYLFPLYSFYPLPIGRREREFNLHEKNSSQYLCNKYLYHVFNFNKTKTYFESQTHLPFLRLTWHKKACLRRDFDLQFPNESISFVTMKHWQKFV